ncbi:MAG: hypothetical protein MRECE_45c004 [Mycoplasmataceae bacterium CE_OT135]|nr:MAG: hypothetical protein MRECE_45c004 [Mycoplasmataceae bacterium CE_OT135]
MLFFRAALFLWIIPFWAALSIILCPWLSNFFKLAKLISFFFKPLCLEHSFSIILFWFLIKVLFFLFSVCRFLSLRAFFLFKDIVIY